ncbi:MAG: hypothetical protein ABIQ40_08005 [Bacteroidia bacterium]
MNNTKLVSLLKSLTSSELRKLQQFVSSPFANTNENVVSLLQHISKHHPAFESPKMEKQKIFKAIFPAETFNDGRIRYLSSELLTVAENFLVYTSYDENPVEKQNRLLKELNKRGLDAIFEMRKKELKSKLEKMPVNSASLLESFKLEETEMFYYQRTLSGRQDKQIRSFNYADVMKALSGYYLEYALKMYCSLLGQQDSYNKKIPFKTLGNTLESLQQDMGEQPEIIQLYAGCVRLLKTKEPQYYYSIRDQLLASTTKSISAEDQRILMSMITNFCVQQYRGGNEIFLHELNNLAKITLERKLFHPEKKMSHVQFANVVLVAIKANDTAWLDDFINDYSAFLPDDVRESTTAFAKASLAYYRKDYKAALRYLRNAKYESPFRQLAIKNLLLKIYFDMDEAELIISLIDSYLHILKDAEFIDTDSKKTYSGFIRIYKSLYRVKQNKDFKLLKTILASLPSTKYVAEYSWLIQKATELDQ